jgi:hypothetical protein
MVVSFGGQMRPSPTYSRCLKVCSGRIGGALEPTLTLPREVRGMTFGPFTVFIFPHVLCDKLKMARTSIE